MSKRDDSVFSRLKTGMSANGKYFKKKLKKVFSKRHVDVVKQNPNVTKRIVLTLLFMILACICVIIGIKAVDYTFEPETENTQNTGFVHHQEDETNGEEQHNAAMLTELQDVDGLSSLLKLWATNTEAEKLHEDGIYNFLLIGIDASAATGYGNSDAIILVSVNTKKSIINMVSFYRDSYTYIGSEYGDNYAKVNAAYANGGASLLVKTIEDDYKIKIDYYASVNFQTFVEVVGLLGGVRLNVPQYVANYISSAWNTNFPAGNDIMLNGEQALMFVRARHCDADSDVSRTRRQREFITSLVSAAKQIKFSQLDDLLKILSKYVKTDCSNTTIISLGTQAIREKWYDYQINSESVPSEKYRTDYRGFGWVWIVDYPGAAQELQNKLYGYSSFIIADGTQSAVEIMRVFTTQPPQTQAETHETASSETQETNVPETLAQATEPVAETTQPTEVTQTLAEPESVANNEPVQNDEESVIS